MKKRRTPNKPVFPVVMMPEEIEQLRQIPRNQRSEIVRNLLREAGYLKPLPEKQSA